MQECSSVSLRGAPAAAASPFIELRNSDLTGVATGWLPGPPALPAGHRGGGPFVLKWTSMRDEGRGGSGGIRWMARLSGIIAVLPASMAAGWAVGYFLFDRTLHIFPWGSIILTLLGAGAGFYEILRILAPGPDRRDRNPRGKS